MNDLFVRVADNDEIPEGKGKLVHVGDEEIALWRIDGVLHALNNVCPHQHFSKLHEGRVEDGFLVCPMHGWSFSLKNGKAKSGNGCAKVYKVKTIGGNVYVDRGNFSGDTVE